MFGGNFASDMVTNGAINRATLAEARLAHSEDVSASNGKLAVEMMEYAAENLGLRFALSKQLSVLDPENPILKEESLREQIKGAAIAAFRSHDRDFDAACDAGSKFKIPGREPAAPPTATLLQQDPEQIKLAYAGVIALRNALSEQLKRFDPENPLLKDLYIQERIRTNAITAYQTSGNFDSAREVGRNFPIPVAP